MIGACLEHPGPGFEFGGKESKSSKKSEFSKKGPLVKNSKTFFFLVSLGCPETFLFYKIFGGSMFSRVWIRICVWGKFCKFLKKAVTFFGKTPCVKNPKRFSFWYHWSTLTLFYLIRFLVGASFEGSGSGFVFAEVAKIVKKASKKVLIWRLTLICTSVL